MPHCRGCQDGKTSVFVGEASAAMQHGKRPYASYNTGLINLLEAMENV
jgi:hypothetical protein